MTVEQSRRAKDVGRYVFLSYAREDLDRVTQLRKTLEEDGIEVWMDVDALPGPLWRDGIDTKLQSAACVLVCWSRTSINKPFVRDEAEQARKNNTLIPVCIDPVPQPIGFGEYQMLDLSQAHISPENKQKLLQAVRNKLTPRPTVLIASTIPDLAAYREQARSAAHAMDFTAILSDDSADEPVSQADIVVVIVAHRYSANVRNIFHSAQKQGKQVLTFLVDPEHSWPTEQKEASRSMDALQSPDPAKLIAEINRDIAALAEFKAELEACQPTPFTDPASIRESLVKTLKEYAEKNPSTRGKNIADHELYLKYLEDDTRQIRIRALKTKRAEPYFFPIDEIYIPLSTISGGERMGRDAGDTPHGRIALEHALTQRKLVLIGEPGSGKSTFLRRVTFELCRNVRGTRPNDAKPFLASTDRRFPILIRIGDLAKFLLTGKPSGKPADSPDWIPHFLDQQSREYKWHLNYDFFEAKLNAGGCLLLIDGLDEAPERRIRERISRIFEKATTAYQKCDFLVTTRPQSYDGNAILAGFHSAHIGQLERDEIGTFLIHFAKALALPDVESTKFQSELNDAVEHRPEIREMAANPVMLTALAVLQHNDQRLPEHRVQLYESILDWLAAAREHIERRSDAGHCLEVMRRLALHMQDAPNGRLVQINRRSAAEFLDTQFTGGVDYWDNLLIQETEDSGIIVPAGSDLKFWHLSFQEYLAAREISSLAEKKQTDLIFEREKLFRPEWRETMRLLGAVLRLQGEAKIEGLVVEVLKIFGTGENLRDKAPCVALLGSMMRDLKAMGYQPKTALYEQTVKAVMSIFEPGESQRIELRTRIEVADALGQVGDPRLEEDQWVTIPAGTFWMGAQKKKRNDRNFDEHASDREAPVHEVTLRAFRISRFLVTVHDYARFVEEKAYKQRLHWKAGGFGEFQEPDSWSDQQKYPNRPVTGVSWFEASAYCVWAGGRLPTEAEWERAARGPQSARFPWGDAPELDATRANYDSEPGHPTPVGLYPFGNSTEDLCDMLGNVWEWTSDWFDETHYKNSAKNDPHGPTDGESKVLRGGSWLVNPRGVRVSERSWDRPTDRNFNDGFRCAGELR